MNALRITSHKTHGLQSDNNETCTNYIIYMFDKRVPLQ